MVPKNSNVAMASASWSAGNVMGRMTVVIIQMRLSAQQVLKNTYDQIIKPYKIKFVKIVFASYFYFTLTSV